MGLNLWGWKNRAKQGQPPVPAGCARLDEALLLGLIQRVMELASGLQEISSVAAGIGREGELLADQLLRLPGAVPRLPAAVEASAELVQQISRYARHLSGSTHKQSATLLETEQRLQESAVLAARLEALLAEADGLAGGLAPFQEARALFGQLGGALSATNERIANARVEAGQSTTVLEQLAATIVQALAAVQQLDGLDGEGHAVELARSVRHKARASAQIAVTATNLATDAVELKRLLDALAREGTAATLP